MQMPGIAPAITYSNLEKTYLQSPLPAAFEKLHFCISLRQIKRNTEIAKPDSATLADVPRSTK